MKRNREGRPREGWWGEPNSVPKNSFVGLTLRKVEAQEKSPEGAAVGHGKREIKPVTRPDTNAQGKVWGG